MVTTTTTITVDNQGKPVAASTEVSVPGMPKLNKSFSEPALDKFGNPNAGNKVNHLDILLVILSLQDDLQN